MWLFPILQFPSSLWTVRGTDASNRGWNFLAVTKMVRWCRSDPIIWESKTQRIVIWLSIFLRMIFACHHEIQGLKQALWFAMESWPQSLFSGAVTFNLSERRALLRRWSRSSWLSLLEWVGWFTLLPMCTVKYESYLAWFFIYASSGWQGFGFEGEEEEAAKEEQRSRFGRS